MILESLIKDGSKLTLDCAKATLSKGSKVEIADEYWLKPEVQNAIKLGLVRLVGSPPPATPATSAKVEENRKKFRSAWTSKLTFDCIKDYVDPGGIIHIPESKLTNSEVQNAIAWGMLVDPDMTAAPMARRPSPPVEIDEIKVGGAKPDKAAPTAKSPVKAKKISKTDDAEAGDEEAQDASLYKPSEVIVPKEDAPPKNKAAAKPAMADEAKPQGSRFDFLDIFEDDAKGGDKEEF
jgi:hypothetical protein